MEKLGGGVLLAFFFSFFQLEIKGKVHYIINKHFAGLKKKCYPVFGRSCHYESDDAVKISLATYS